MPIQDDTATAATPNRALIFISYARADRPRVAPLADALKAMGFDVWWDALIEGGAGFASAIEAKLDAADAVVVAWSAASVGSDWVRDEAAHARDRKRLVPVSIDGTQAPLGFRQYHTIDLSKWRGHAGSPEVAAIAAGIAGVGATTAAVGPVRVSAPRVTRRAAVLGGASAAVLAGGGLIAFRLIGGGHAGNSVAVLPFANLSNDKSQAYFSDGLSEEIRSALARNPELKVAAPTSANIFRDRQADAKVIGSSLGVAFLLEGSVRRAGDVVRIAAELVDSQSGFSKWSQSFDRRLTDVFAVQSEIAGVVAGALAARMTGVAKAVGGTTVVAAYDALLKGRALYNSDSGEESDRAALAQFDTAIAADPKYADAYAARSRVLAGMASKYAKGQEVHRLYEDAIVAAKRAVVLAPDLAAAQLALGYATNTGRLDTAGARGPYESAARLGAGDADVLLAFAQYCARAGRAHDALGASQRALSLDPLNPRAFRAAGTVRYIARRYNEALPLLDKAISMNAKISNAYAIKGQALIMLGRYRDARKAFLREPVRMFKLTGLSIVEHKLGANVAAQGALTSLIAEFGDAAVYQQAQIHAQAGSDDAAFAALRRAKAVGDSGFLFLATDPLLDPLRKDPIFAGLLESAAR